MPFTTLYFLTALICLQITFVNAQVHKVNIISSFNKVDYYSDSTIKAAYKTKKGQYHDYAIEFDSTGNPTSIGKYKKGVKTGAWRHGCCKTFHYKNGRLIYISVSNYDLLSERRMAEADFENLFLHLIRIR